MKVEFIQDWKDCNKKGDIRDVATHFGIVLIEAGFAKAVNEPTKHKMIGESPKKKGQYGQPYFYVG